MSDGTQPDKHASDSAPGTASYGRAARRQQWHDMVTRAVRPANDTPASPHPMVYLFLYVSFGVFVFGTVTAVRIHRELQHSRATLGTVTDVVPTVDTDGDGSGFHYVFGYDIDGSRYIYTTPWSSHPPAYHVGERVWIAYHPRRPRDARIATLAGSYVMPWIMLGIGTFVGLTCLGLIFSQPIMRWLHPHLYA